MKTSVMPSHGMEAFLPVRAFRDPQPNKALFCLVAPESRWQSMPRRSRACVIFSATSIPIGSGVGRETAEHPVIAR